MTMPKSAAPPSSPAPARPLPDRPGEVLLPEPMLRFRCNEQGCCCQGWSIPFELEDFVRLYRALPEPARGELGRGLLVRVRPAGMEPEPDEPPDWDALWAGGPEAAKAARVGAAEARAVRDRLGGAVVHAPDAGQRAREEEATSAATAAAASPSGPPVPAPRPPPQAGATGPVGVRDSISGPAAAGTDASGHVLESLHLGVLGEEKRCRFLAPGGGCEVHRDHGVWALPGICVNFPAFGYASPGDGAVELWWDPVCPEVLRQLDESDAPLALHRAGRDAPVWQEPGFALRVANTERTLRARLRTADLTRADLEVIRTGSLRALADSDRPAWRSLAAVLTAYQRLPATGPAGFRTAEPEDPVPFLAFFGGCIGTHGAPLLVWALEGYRRFSREIDLGPLLADPRALQGALDAWGPALDEHVAPREESLRPLMLRWLAHHFAMPFVAQTGDLRSCADTIAMIYGTSLRYAGGFAAALGRPLDRQLYRLALGAAEYFYRSLVFRRDSLPWFASAESYQAPLVRVTTEEEVEGRD